MSDFGVSSIGDKLRTQTRSPRKKVVNNALQTGIVMLPLTDTMQGALSTRVVWDCEQLSKESKNFCVKFRTLALLRPSVNWQEVPPHVACAVQRISALFLKVGQVRRTSRRHYLLKKRKERAECP